MRLTAWDEVQQVAGHCTQQGCADGTGDAARFSSIRAIAPDGMGCVFVADGPQLRRVQLPDHPPGCADAVHNTALGTPCSTAALAAGARCTAHGSAPDARGLLDAASSSATPAAQVAPAASGSAVVTTLYKAPASIIGLAFVPQTGALLLATATAVYRALPPPPPLLRGPCCSPAAVPTCNSTYDAETYSGRQTSASAGCTSCCMQDSMAAMTQVVLVAGCEGASGVQADAECGQEARFNNIRGLAADDRCDAYVLDWCPGGTGTCATRVRSVGVDGRVRSLGPDLPCFAHDPCVLAGLGSGHGGGGGVGGAMGCLATCSSTTGQLWLVALPGLQPALPVVAALQKQQGQQLAAGCSGGELVGWAGPCGWHGGWTQGEEHRLAADLGVLLSCPPVGQRNQRQQHGQQACSASERYYQTRQEQQHQQEHLDHQHHQQPDPAEQRQQSTCGSTCTPGSSGANTATDASAAPSPPRHDTDDLPPMGPRLSYPPPDVTIHVAGVSFHAHRTILAARSEYICQRLSLTWLHTPPSTSMPPSAPSSLPHLAPTPPYVQSHLQYPASGTFDALQPPAAAPGQLIYLDLPDAHPDSFAALLMYMYTDRLAVSPHLLRPTLELADRLLLPGCVWALRRRLAGSTWHDTVAGDVRWAEARGCVGLARSMEAAHRHQHKD